MLMDRNTILENRNDLIEGTFCYELFELQIFNEKLFFELIDGINKHLSATWDGGGKLDQEMLSFLPWFVMGVMNSIICHNDKNDRYVIKQLDMSLWHEIYEEKLSSLLNRIITCA
ncbi:MAG: hypothetical protein FWG14_11325 [Peptococcaceae bacterium]|nr:hypothetical protein [Peptococcaceae bacterium]